MRCCVGDSEYEARCFTRSPLDTASFSAAAIETLYLALLMVYLSAIHFPTATADAPAFPGPLPRSESTAHATISAYGGCVDLGRAAPGAGAGAGAGRGAAEVDAPAVRRDGRVRRRLAPGQGPREGGGVCGGGREVDRGEVHHQQR
mmetsp:Transcript_16412/g.55400  ORF Transcript_16412/g.55400 Transcript_16412/m.55400 type:complete len:146 (+) Transcript_16412:760-1197(+)